MGWTTGVQFAASAGTAVFLITVMYRPAQKCTLPHKVDARGAFPFATYKVVAII
jgi:hypothetical protein